MKNIFILFAFIISLNIQKATATEKWTLEKEEDNIKIYLREKKGASLKEFRGVTYVEDTKLSTLLALLDDTKSYTKWFYNCVNAKVLKIINKRERITYTEIKSPWPVTNRDSVVYTKVIQNKKTFEIRVLLMNRPAFIAKKSDLVRIPKLTGFWSFKPLKTGRVKIIYQIFNDPGGNIPDMLANAFVVDMPFYTLKNMRTIIKQKKYRDAVYPLVKELKY